MKIIRNETTTESLSKADYFRHDLDVELAIGDTVIVIVNGQEMMNYTVIREDANIDFNLQDAGLEELLDIDRMKYQRDMMDKQIVEEETKILEEQSK